ncbi:aminoglycoside adenylyltransferase domain-containing protein [Ktedonobacter racemifer]|uniref:Adenylyltransferase AadA C-terminal domain-containing protein n=1 Tax=Ktedonobacter racemifer DSM 44963 TaxID=485913 RepID=D6TBW9_KTERA|nr:aminoglycoside adenylyltransferase domain-containing protein [Ktedonobacter racemifer]EFH89901.1 conserved hypothetical protein [Ktedonobacter racemifer DSM 44963]
MSINPDTRLQNLPPEIQTYSLQMVQLLHNYLQGNLLGVYIVGSAALGGFIAGRSDIDIQGVCARQLSQEEKEQITSLLAHPSLPCPTRGCEFVLYSREKVTIPSPTAGFEVNLNSGPQMCFHVTYDSKDESFHWFLLDRSIAREHGISIFGPDAHELFGVIPRTWLLNALLTSLRWHTDHDEAGYSSILNACRGWRFAEENQWSSKVDAIEWAKTRVADGELLTQALALRAGTCDKTLDQKKVKQFLNSIRERIEQVQQVDTPRTHDRGCFFHPGGL